MLKIFQKLTKNLSIKNIVLLGVIVMALIITVFVVTMTYLSSTIKYDQKTLKNILDLEKQNQNVLTIIRKINYIENKIIISESLDELEKIENELINKDSVNLIYKEGTYLVNYNKKVEEVSKNLLDLIEAQQNIFSKKYVVLFYKEEIKSYKKRVDSSIKKIIDETEGLYGKSSLFSKRYTRRNKQNIDLAFLYKFERVMSLSKDLDSSASILSGLIANIYSTNDLNVIRSIKLNSLSQVVSLFENSSIKVFEYKEFDKRFEENIYSINQEFYRIKDLLTLFISAKEQMLFEEKKLFDLLSERTIMNKDLVEKIKNLNQISEKIENDILSHSDFISKTTTIVIIIVGVVSLFLLFLAASTLIYRINFPLDFIINYIEKIKSKKTGLSSKLPIVINDEFGKLSKSFNSMTSTINKNIKEIQNLNKEIEDTQKEVILTMGAIGETRSKETGNHVKRVAEYSKILAIKYGLSEKEASLLKEASPMHDIGKVGIPDFVLKKPAKLNDEEWQIMKTHAQLGYEMLKHSNRKILKAAAIVAKEHHEKWDGSGYPEGLKGEDIHIYGRITAVADVFDALGSDRCYKKAWPLEKILELFKEEKGKHFDPKLVDLLFENIDEIIYIRDKYKDIFD
ncbi:HD-GYP domain-containing protein [Halarcobacter bivalviorum]|uniref:Response regulator c-di-GMP phosphodiesterase, RpfG family n=2 Tax=Halarcobacter bivalviorum TaxID=663364 RepID=A0AB33GLL5_9BACT|nr:HD domain-containing phosphohydrolase [Halarcobacter bivalviorum]AXH13011.1 response regulator c-di-GMP phosphodiesterase, RpfG family [Halarcobacter bivalviorum]